MVLHALVEDLYLTYYIPVIAEADLIPKVPLSANRETDDEHGTNEANATRQERSQ